ncbi:MAG: peptidoglycan DD-metalloendopeptidase family protein [Clostridia bacterium]|nr:peptidoglycan DD-metalloendopeptidase family protein [Clostridia bacterium]
MNKKVVLTILFIILFLTIWTGIVIAENVNDLQERKNELQNQLEESNEQINQIQIELTNNLQQLNNLNEKIYGYEAEIATLENNVNDIEKQISEVTKKLNLIQENYNLQKDILQNRIVALYESGDILYLDVLLSSNTLSEFVTNYYLIGEIAKHDNELLENIDRQKTQIETIKVSLEENKENLKTIKKNKEKTVIALENSKIIRNSYINKLTEQEKETQNKIDAFQIELNNIETQIVALTTGSANPDYTGGELAWPAPGYTTITSNFGMRYHPIFKVNRMHSGTDIGMPTGAYIVAANDGIVIQSMYTTGYGNMVMIDHGGGISTVYGHGSEIIAQTGQTVKKGDIIMKAGSTGWSTGPHLHFEIRVNGKCIDPLPYITKQSEDSTNQKTEEKNNE